MRFSAVPSIDSDETIYSLSVSGYDKQRAYGAADGHIRAMWGRPSTKVSDHLLNLAEMARIIERLNGEEPA